jgi:hypothetical protein
MFTRRNFHQFSGGSMEHRCTERLSSHLNVLIHQNHVPVAIGRIKNGSHMGVYIESDFANIDCERQISIEVLLNQPTQNSKLHRLEISALVIHKTAQGFGAELDIKTQEQADSFVTLLRSSNLGHTQNHVHEEPLYMPIFARAANN